MYTYFFQSQNTKEYDLDISVYMLFMWPYFEDPIWSTFLTRRAISFKQSIGGHKCITAGTLISIRGITASSESTENPDDRSRWPSPVMHAVCNVFISLYLLSGHVTDLKSTCR